MPTNIPFLPQLILAPGYPPLGRGATVQRNSTWGQKCRSPGGLWGHEKFPNTAEAISVSAIKKIFSPYNCSNDIMMSDHLFCKANSELSHFFMLRNLSGCFSVWGICNLSFRSHLYLSFVVEVLK